MAFPDLNLHQAARRLPGRLSAHWEVKEIPGLYLLKHPEGWLLTASLQQRSLAYRIWEKLQDQRFRSLEEALQATQAALGCQRER